MPLFNQFVTASANTFSETEIFTPSTTSGVPIIVRGLSSQSGNLQQWQNSAGTVLNRVDKGGYGNPPGLTLYGLAAPAGGAAAAGGASPGANLSASTTYYYLLTGVDYAGKETPSTLTFSLSEGGTPTKVDLSWTSYTPANAQYINIYKGTSSTVSALRLLAQVASSAATYTDDGTVATTGTAPPASPPLIGSLLVQGVGTLFSQAPVATANYGLVSIGSGAFDGSTSGKFAGSSAGTQVAINAASGSSAALIDAQVAGSSKFSVTAAGALTATTIDATKLTGSVPLGSLSGLTTSQLSASAGVVAAQIASVNPSTLTGTGTVPTAGLPAATTGAQGAVQLASAVPARDVTTTGTAGSAGTVSPSDHAHPLNSGLWTPADHGLLAWSQDPYIIANHRQPTAAVLYLVRLKTPVAISVTNVIICVDAVGSGLTNCYLGLYTTAGTLVASTADQSSVWTTTGLYTTALVGNPFSVAAGSFFVGIQVGGGTAPQIKSHGNQGTPFESLANVNVSQGTGRVVAVASGNAVLGAATMASTTVQNLNFWVAVS